MTVAQLDRSVTPSSPDAEKAVLGSVLEAGERVLLRIPEVREQLFENPQNRAVWRAISLLSEEREPIEPLTVIAHLRNSGRLTAAGGAAYVSGLLDVVPDIANVESYARLLEESAKKRAILKAVKEAERGVMSGEASSDTIAGLFSSIGDQATPKKMQARPLWEVASETIAKMTSLREREESLALPTTWPTLNRLQIFAPTLIVLGGHAKTGKSAAMMNLADDIAAMGSPTAVFSLESRKHEITLRHMSMTTGIPHSRMRDWRTFNEADFEKMRDYSAKVGNRKVFIEDGVRCAEDIVMELRRLSAVHGVKAALIDYIQNVELRRRVDNREERLHEVSKMFLDVANDLGISVMAMSQLRDEAGKDGKRLTIADLAYAKSIAKSARIVMFINRPIKTDPSNDRGPLHMDVQVEAHNEGQTGDFVAQFDEIRQKVWEGKCEKPCGHPDCSRERADIARQERLY